MDRFGFIHEKLDIKILILYILRRLPGVVDPETLLELCQCDGGIGYFDYSDCLSELVEALVPQLTEISMLGEDLVAGEDSEVVETELGRIGGLVCFDSIYENLALDSARDGAQIIVLGTNDSWFLDSAAVYMHNAQAKLRAVETGRYVVRAANTGISSIITPNGVVLDEEPPLVGGYVISDVAMRDNATVYSVIGNLFVYTLIAGMFFLAASKKLLTTKQEMI